ncbi:dnaJ homolog subfamily C member 21-like [Lineus longissimus]|uniref:dnaJ homolog subfamily C member 21-like n=1 Tax=Lineus longissimus TaxID=88925 RepID=UPI002B4F2B42
MSPPKGPMKCYYEVLNVERDAGEDEFKKSYRKLALKWHPDKNLDNQDEASEQFRLIQQAYDVLMDRHERAWYDKHREEILRGGCGFGDNYQDNSLNIFQYFTAACYSGYGDDEDGFYATYREVFKKLSAEDYEFMDDEDSDYNFPDFGASQSSYEEVVHDFYSFWESFCTSKSFAWKDEFDTREAPNRRVRRLMEAENKKLRDAAKKERNAEIRNLVAFIKKRDRRVQAHKKKLEERIAVIAKQDAERKEKQKKERIKKYESYQETEWSAMSQLEKELQNMEAHFDEQFGDEAVEFGSGASEEEDEEEVYYDDMFCVACNKTFKTEKAFANHENSKKHKENVVFLKTQMAAEEDDLGKDDLDPDEDMLGDRLLDDTDLLEDIKASNGLEAQPKTKLSKKQKKKRKELQKQQQKLIDDEQENESENDGSAEKDPAPEIEVKKDVPSQSQQKDSKPQADSNQPQPEISTVAEETAARSEQPSKEKNKKAKDGKKPVKPQEEEEEETNQPEHHYCNTCKKEFPTRNKLFDHLKTTGHQLRVPSANEHQGSSKKLNKKKGKR